MTYASASAAPRAFGHQPPSWNPERDAANLEAARRYLATIEASTDHASGVSTAAIEEFFTADILQEEFPNRFVPSGARRDLAALREAAERGRAVMRGQRYEVRAAYAVGETVILEVLWVGTLGVSVGSLTAGQEMRAHFAVVLEFREGHISRQRNYDCFEPF